MTIASSKNEEQIQEDVLLVFRKSIRIMRDDLGISQSELARRIARSASYVCDIERGRRNPNLTTVALFAEALGCTPPVLLSLSLAARKVQPPPAASK